MPSRITLSPADLYFLIQKAYPKLDLLSELPHGVAVVHPSRRTVYLLTKTQLFTTLVSEIARDYPQESVWDVDQDEMLLPDAVAYDVCNAITLQRMHVIGAVHYTVIVVGSGGIGFVHFDGISETTRSGLNAITDITQEEAVFSVKAIFNRPWRAGVVVEKETGPINNPDKIHPEHEARTRLVVLRNHAFSLRVEIDHSNGK